MAGCFSVEISSHRGKERGKSYAIPHHNGARICQKTFVFLHTMDYWLYKAIKANYMSNGVVVRFHSNTGKLKKLGLSLKEIQDVVQFILKYAGVCGGERERGGGGGEGRTAIEQLFVLTPTVLPVGDKWVRMYL